jgi:hypothetical protein
VTGVLSSLPSANSPRPPSLQSRALRLARRLIVAPMRRFGLFGGAAYGSPEGRTYRPRVAIGPVGEGLFERLQALCRANKIGYMTGAAADPWMRGFHIEETDAPAFLAALRDALLTDSRFHAQIGTRAVGLDTLVDRVSPRKHRYFDLLCEESSSTVEADLSVFSSVIRVMFWGQVISYSAEPVYEVLTPIPYVQRLREPTLREMMSRGADISADRDRYLYEFDFPIDVVFTWVDDQDPEWQKEKDFYTGEAGRKPTAGRALAAERFRNRDELKYSLRSIEMFAPFVRHIYIVTNGQRPDWLDDTSDRITLVSHRDIYRDPAVLPTFNSSGIETQLHHIPGLAEHFLYFNDDFMLADFCTPEDFFFANGLMKYFPSDSKAFDPDIDDSREEYLIADRNAINLMRRDYKAFGRDLMVHAPYPSRKSLLEDLERSYQTEFDVCAAHRFRSKEDLRPIAFMQPHFGFAKGLAIPSVLPNRYLALWKPVIGDQFDNVYKTRRYKAICINDVGVPEERAEEVDRLTRSFLQKYFPLPSRFERKHGVTDLVAHAAANATV